MVIPAAVSAAARTEPGLQTVWHLFSAVPGRMRITPKSDAAKLPFFYPRATLLKA